MHSNNINNNYQVWQCVFRRASAFSFSLFEFILKIFSQSLQLKSRFSLAVGILCQAVYLN
jgi:hypothetical protein